MATLVQTNEDSNNVFFVNTLLVSDKDLHTGFASAQDIPLTEDFNGEKLVEVRKCLINNLQY